MIEVPPAATGKPLAKKPVVPTELKVHKRKRPETEPLDPDKALEAALAEQKKRAAGKIKMLVIKDKSSKKPEKPPASPATPKAEPSKPTPPPTSPKKKEQALKLSGMLAQVLKKAKVVAPNKKGQKRLHFEIVDPENHVPHGSKRRSVKA